MGRRQHRFHILRTYPCRRVLFHSPSILQMAGIHSCMSRIRYTCLCLQLLANVLLHNNSFRRANVDACLTVNAHLFVNFRFFVLYRYCRRGAFIYTGLASGTFTGVNDCNQFIHSIVYVRLKIKNRFRYNPLKNYDILLIWQQRFFTELTIQCTIFGSQYSDFLYREYEREDSSDINSSWIIRSKNYFPRLSTSFIL